jgi:hypothetical protein
MLRAPDDQLQANAKVALNEGFSEFRRPFVETPKEWKTIHDLQHYKCYMYNTGPVTQRSYTYTSERPEGRYANIHKHIG